MRAQIENFGPVKLADIELDRITMLVGDNGVGKSSIAQALGFALTGTTYNAENPQNRAYELVRDGAPNGSRIRVFDDAGEVTLTYPDCKHSATGVAPRSSLVAVGMESICKMKPADRAAVVQKYLRTLPTPEELTDALSKVGVEGKNAEAVVDYVEKYGWEKAHDHYKNQGALHKSLWAQEAGEAWGSTKQASFIPQYWDNSLQGMSEQTLVEELAREREILETSLKVEAISEKEIADLEEESKNLDDLALRVQVLKEHADKARAKVKEAQDLLKTLPKPDFGETGVPCPHCKRDLIIEGDTLRKVKPADLYTDEEKNEMAQAILAQKEFVAEAMKAENQALDNLSDAQVKLAQAKKAAERLAVLKAKGAQEAPPAAVVEKQRANVERANRRLKAWTQRTKLDQHAENISQNLYIVGVLKQEGLRLTKQSAGLKTFNQEYLKRVCELADWGLVELHDDMTITYDGRSYHRCSGGLRWRCRMTLQIALAWLEPCSLLILDDDVQIDDAGRGGLIQILENFKAPSLVCFVISKEHDIPDLSDESWGCGKTYVFEDGVTKLFTAKDAVPA